MAYVEEAGLSKALIKTKVLNAEQRPCYRYLLTGDDKAGWSRAPPKYLHNHFDRHQCTIYFKAPV